MAIEQYVRITIAFVELKGGLFSDVTASENDIGLTLDTWESRGSLGGC